jgi:hypothetical protein
MSYVMGAASEEPALEVEWALADEAGNIKFLISGQFTYFVFSLSLKNASFQWPFFLSNTGYRELMESVTDRQFQFRAVNGAYFHLSKKSVSVFKTEQDVKPAA